MSGPGFDTIAAMDAAERLQFLQALFSLLLAQVSKLLGQK